MKPSAYTKKLRLQLALACLPLLIAATATGQLLSGYSLPAKDLIGPVQSRIATDPIWVVDYHTLVIEYRASGHLNPAAAVLSLRPGSVGPAHRGRLTLKTPSSREETSLPFARAI